MLRTLQNTYTASFISENFLQKLRPETPCHGSVKVMTGFHHPNLENQNASGAIIYTNYTDYFEITFYEVISMKISSHKLRPQTPCQDSAKKPILKCLKLEK